jgi:glycosyltransferase involved in cell wall biosynthesis
VHYPRFDPGRPEVDLRWYHLRPALAVYLRLCTRIGDFSPARMRSNLTLVNSDWTRRRVRALHGIEPTVLFPPVPGDFPDVPWSEREDGVVCLGRLSPEKRVEDVVAVVEAVGRPDATCDCTSWGTRTSPPTPVPSDG